MTKPAMPKIVNDLWLKNVSVPVGYDGSLPLVYSIGDGLRFVVQASGRKSWSYRLMVDGRNHERGLGTYPQVSLKEARIKAGELADQMRGGNLAVGKRKGKPKTVSSAPTFRELGEEYRLLHEPSWKHQAHKDQWRQTLQDYAYPVLGDMAVDSITRADVKRAIEPIWITKHETASNTLNSPIDEGHPRFAASIADECPPRPPRPPPG